eukprot:CAMPEP_0177641662 /NCGR_PEP_ID=MMETSP0447-20121125/7183_1 /TAXON_ID=0 /ORGANISM="Stygamoeba regulata, Strain BSH-02190019" /LENGTH=197 /DNA_ID=CAMNT_0019143789 /DNA_START=13 /DNA_END=606 /DNA_ORIENTATION=-
MPRFSLPHVLLLFLLGFFQLLLGHCAWLVDVLQALGVGGEAALPAQVALLAHTPDEARAVLAPRGLLEVHMAERVAAVLDDLLPVLLFAAVVAELSVQEVVVDLAKVLLTECLVVVFVLVLLVLAAALSDLADALAVTAEPAGSATIALLVQTPDELSALVTPCGLLEGVFGKAVPGDFHNCCHCTQGTRTTAGKPN